MAKKTLYEILEIPPDANDVDVQLAYQKRTYELKRDDPPDPNALAIVKQAHDVLSDPKRRAAYDASLKSAGAAAQQAQATTTIMVEDVEDEEKSKSKQVAIALAAIVGLVVAVVFALRTNDPPLKTAAAPPKEAPKPPPPPPPQPLGAQQILPNALLSVGQVMSFEMSGQSTPIGLALAVEPSAVLTTCHGIPAGGQIVVKIGAEQLSANLSTTDELLDLCRLTVPGLNVKPLNIATDEAKAGDKIFALGANAKGEFALTEGTVKAARMAPSVKYLEVSMPIAVNGSGGAVFDAYGNLVGIATTPHRFGPGVNAAISSAWISQMRTRDRPQ